MNIYVLILILILQTYFLSVQHLYIFLSFNLWESFHTDQIRMLNLLMGIEYFYIVQPIENVSYAENIMKNYHFMF